MNILIFIQSEENKISRSSIETICGMQKLGDENDTISTISLNASINDELQKYNINTNYFVDGIDEFHPIKYTSALENIINQKKPDVIAFAHTYQARDWVPRLSARLNIPFISDCININKNDDNSIIATKQMYQGKVNADIRSNSPVIISLQSGAFRADEVENGTASTQQINIEIDNNDSIKPLDKFRDSKGDVDLSSADIIVSVGRGISKEENMHLVEELSKSLSAELGSSRPVVDYGWLSHERQVGSSGQVVSPKLYLAVGISGAIQHQVGMKGSNNIMAINKDPKAPIFEIADYGIVGDLFEIIPKLNDLIKNHKS